LINRLNPGEYKESTRGEGSGESKSRYKKKKTRREGEISISEDPIQTLTVLALILSTVCQKSEEKQAALVARLTRDPSSYTSKST